MKNKYLSLPAFALSALAISSCLTPVRAEDPALNINDQSPTQFMIGYSVWHGESGSPASFLNETAGDAKYYDAKLIAAWGKGQLDDLAAGMSPRNINNVYCATPSYTGIKQDGTPMPRGYRSDDPGAIRYHAQLIEGLGASIIVPDLTNNIPGLFPDPASGHTPTENNEPRGYNALVATLHEMHQAGASPHSNLRIVPCLGAFVGNDISTLGSDNLTSFQRALKFVTDPLRIHTELAVSYQGKLLVMVFHAPGIDDRSVVAETDRQAAGYNVTLKHVNGFIESQKGLWYTSTANTLFPPYVRAADNTWTWVDRLARGGLRNGSLTSYESYDSYTEGPTRTEFVSVTTFSPDDRGVHNAGVVDDDGVAETNFLPWRGGMVFNQMMSLAKSKHPNFVLLNQWNHFVSHDSGFTVQTTRDIEPTVEWGDAIYNQVKATVTAYKAYESGGGIPRFENIAVRGIAGTGLEQLVAGFFCTGSAAQRIVIKAIGQSLAPFFQGGTSVVAVDPKIELYGENSTWIATNDSWRNESDHYRSASLLANRVFMNSESYVSTMEPGATIRPEEAAITADFDPGHGYTVRLTDMGGSNRQAHIRLVPQDTVSDAKLNNFSASARVESGDRILIYGFTLAKPMTVGIFGHGPSLAGFYPSGTCLEDPELVLFSGPTQIYSSSDLTDDTQRAQLATHTFGLNPKDAALKVTLPPGAYTVHLRNQAPNSARNGIGLLEVIEWW